MNITEQQYLGWQKRLTADSGFKIWWQFWSNYSTVLLIPVAIYFWLNQDLWPLASLAISAFVVARLLFIPIFNLFYQKSRPYQKYNFKPLTSRMLSWETTKPTAFPSRHIISFAAVAGILLLPMPLLAGYLLVTGLLTGIGRIVLGFHDFWDISSAIIIGVLIGILMFGLFG